MKEAGQEDTTALVTGVINTPPRTTKEFMALMMSSMEKMADGEAKEFAQATIGYLESKKLSTKLKNLKADVEQKVEKAAEKCRTAIDGAFGQVTSALKKAEIGQKAEAVSKAVGKAFEAVGEFADTVGKAVYNKVPQPVKDFADKCKRRGREFITNAGYIGRGVAAVMSEATRTIALKAAKGIGETLKAAGTKVAPSGDIPSLKTATIKAWEKGRGGR